MEEEEDREGRTRVGRCSTRVSHGNGYNLARERWTGPKGREMCQICMKKRKITDNATTTTITITTTTTSAARFTIITDTNIDNINNYYMVAAKPYGHVVVLRGASAGRGRRRRTAHNFSKDISLLR